MKTLMDYLPESEKKEIDITEAERLASTKYKDDENIQILLRIWRYGISGKKTKNGKTEGIPPFSDFAKKNLIKAIKLREEGKVFHKPKPF